MQRPYIINRYNSIATNVTPSAVTIITRITDLLHHLDPLTLTLSILEKSLKHNREITGILLTSHNHHEKKRR